MNKKILTTTLALGLTVLATGAMASPRDHAESRHDARPAVSASTKLFRSLDRNGNGVVSKGEFRREYGSNRESQRTFARLDANRDGVLSRWEVAGTPRVLAVR